MPSSSGQGQITPGEEIFDRAGSAGVPGSAGPRRVQATVITGAEESYDDQLKRRRTRYMIMMGMRVPFLIVACLLYQTPWLALLVIAISVPLPWMAVLVANDRPARKRAKVVPPGTINYEKALPAPGYQVGQSGLRDTETVDADPDLSAGAAGRS